MTADNPFSSGTRVRLQNHIYPEDDDDIETLSCSLLPPPTLLLTRQNSITNPKHRKRSKMSFITDYSFQEVNATCVASTCAAVSCQVDNWLDNVPESEQSESESAGLSSGYAADDEKGSQLAFVRSVADEVADQLADELSKAALKPEKHVRFAAVVETIGCPNTTGALKPEKHVRFAAVVETIGSTNTTTNGGHIVVKPGGGILKTAGDLAAGTDKSVRFMVPQSGKQVHFAAGAKAAQPEAAPAQAPRCKADLMKSLCVDKNSLLRASDEKFPVQPETGDYIAFEE